MTAAEFALDEQQPGRAIAAIEQMHGGGSRHIHSLRAALRAHEQAGDWPRVLQLLRLLEKRDALPEPAIRGLRVRACRGLFARANLDAAGVRELLRGLKSAERELPEAVEAAAAAFAQAGDQAQARKLIEAAMDREFSPLLLRRYAQLDEIPARERIERTEAWMQRYGDDGALALVLGRLCMSASLWGKAEELLRRSLGGERAIEAHLALAEMYEGLGRAEEAASHYRSAALAREPSND
jgi:HemY protein